MKTYYIINFQNDEVLGTVTATSIKDAEYKAAGIWQDVQSDDLMAFTEV